MEFAEQGQGETTLLFIHGYGDSWYSSSGMLAALPPGFRALAPSLRGHGETDKPRQGYSIGQHAEDILTFMTEQRVERPIIVGHSMGTFIAQEIAIRAPARLSHMALIGSATTADNPVLGGMLSETLKLPDPVPRQFVQDFQAGTCVNPLGLGMTIEEVVRQSAKLPLHVWQEALRGLIAYRPQGHDASDLARITTPALILWGVRDEIFLRDEQRRLHDAIAGAELKIARNSGHAVNWEFPAETLGHILAFAGHEYPVVENAGNWQSVTRTARERANESGLV